MKTLSHYNILNVIEALEPKLPDLQPFIDQCLNTRIRRIDRYIKLCLAGGLNCTKGQTLPSNTGLYLATRCGTVDTSAKIMQHIEHNNDLPKPINFINSLGNSAGFYLTKSLGLTGNTLVISQELLSFEAALLHAWIDLIQGRISHALVGGFDEVATPITHHITRLNGKVNCSSLTEGSHWLLLANDNNTIAHAIEQPIFFTDESTLTHWLTTQKATHLQTAFTPTESEYAILNSGNFTQRYFTTEALTHGTYSGAAFINLYTSLASSGDTGIHLAKNNNGHYCAITINHAQG